MTRTRTTKSGFTVPEVMVCNNCPGEIYRNIMDDVPNPLNLRLGWTDFNYFSFPNAQKTSINDLKMEADRRLDCDSLKEWSSKRLIPLIHFLFKSYSFFSFSKIQFCLFYRCHPFFHSLELNKQQQQQQLGGLRSGFSRTTIIMAKLSD